jgi:hypothetical protein
MDEKYFRQQIANTEVLDDLPLFREMCSHSVLRNGRLLPVAMMLTRSKTWTSEIVTAFVECVDQFLAVYASPGEAKMSVDAIHTKNPKFFAEFRAVLEDPGDDQMADVLIDEGGGSILHVPRDRVIARRRKLLEES